MTREGLGFICQDSRELLLVLGEGPGLVGHHGEVDALAGGRPDEAGVGGDGQDTEIVAGGEYGERTVLDLSCQSLS